MQANKQQNTLFGYYFTTVCLLLVVQVRDKQSAWPGSRLQVHHVEMTVSFSGQVCNQCRQQLPTVHGLLVY